ncbi:MAG: hypothetical protein DELT_00288 [Desulfovibrio sp.]
MAHEMGEAPHADVAREYAGRVYFVNLDPYSPNQGQTLAIAEALVKEGWDAHIFCRESCRLATLAEKFSLPVHVFSDTGGKSLPLAWRLLRVIRVVEKKNPARHLVHACDPSASQLVSLAWKLNKKLRVVHTRRVPIMEANHKAVRCYQTPQAKIITDSLAGKIALRLSGLDPHLLHTITCGIDPSCYPVRKDRGDGRFVFAMTGELMPQRGHAQLFEALPLVESGGMPPWEVRILGEGPHFPLLLDEAQERGVIERLAFLSGVDPGVELSHCDALVLPAPEGESYLPLILQGWAARVPIITVNRLDHAEVLQDEANCLLMHPSDMDGLARQMQRIATDSALRERLVEGGKSALARFSLRTMVSEHKRLYRDILA